jgi:hypothetical protein
MGSLFLIRFTAFMSGPKDGWEQGELTGLLKDEYLPSQIFKV